VEEDAAFLQSDFCIEKAKNREQAKMIWIWRLFRLFMNEMLINVIYEIDICHDFLQEGTFENIFEDFF